MAREGQYQDPKVNIARIPKVLCAMCIYVPEGQIEECSVRSNKNPGIYNPFIENKLESIKFTLAAYKHYNSGVDFKLVLINNGTKDPETLAFLDDLPYDVYHRENSGFSFGAHKFAWETFRDNDLYDYYLFHEQDWGPAKENWLKEILWKFLSDKEVGAVGNVVESRPTAPIGSIGDLKKILGIERDYMFNLDGCYTFTSAKVLKQVDKHGGLKVLDCEPNTRLDASYNEILFQQPIMELGYKLTSFHKQNYLQVAGISIGDLSEEQERISLDMITPIIQGNLRFFSEKIKRYFNWYTPPRKTYLILGMHRSGTSMTSHICNLMGIDLGNKEYLMPADTSNQDGYWENKEFTKLNDDILHAAGGIWYNPPTVEAVKEIAHIFEERAKRLINKHKNECWGIKDPRLIFTYPVYLPFLENVNIIAITRDIKAVVNSILKVHSCNLPSEFKTKEYVKQLYERYYNGLEKIKEMFLNVEVEFERYFDNPDLNIKKLMEFVDYKKDKEPLCNVISHKFRNF